MVADGSVKPEARECAYGEVDDGETRSFDSFGVGLAPLDEGRANGQGRLCDGQTLQPCSTSDQTMRWLC